MRAGMNPPPPGNQMEHTLSHERLDAYQLATEVARWVRNNRFPIGESDLHNQAKRAADSVVLNLAEGAYRSGADRQRHFKIAAGSAAEACAVFDLIILPEGPSRQKELRRIVAMLHKLR